MDHLLHAAATAADASDDGGFNQFMDSESIEEPPLPAQPQWDEQWAPYAYDVFVPLAAEAKAAAEPPPANWTQRMESFLNGLSDIDMSKIAHESTPTKTNKRMASLTLCIHLKNHFSDVYDNAASDAKNLETIIMRDPMSTMSCSDEALCSLTKLLNAVSSNRILATASRISRIRTTILKHLDGSQESQLAFARFKHHVRCTDGQREEADAISLARTVARQDARVEINERELYKTMHEWASNQDHQELMLLFVQLCSGLRFSEVTDFAGVQLVPFDRYIIEHGTSFPDNVPQCLVDKAINDSAHFLVNIGQHKKRGGQGMICIRPIPGGFTSYDVLMARGSLFKKRIHNKSVNRTLKRFGMSLVADFRRAKRNLSCHSLRGVWQACCTVMKPREVSMQRYHNSILGYPIDATCSQRYDVCVCV